MILFDLKCAKDHVFEGWFRDGQAFDDQVAARKISCPLCGSRKIDKAVMAPRIGKGGGEPNGCIDEQAATALRGLAELRRKVEENCDYVGPRFAEEARRIHDHEVKREEKPEGQPVAKPKGIYGEATKEETAELEEEGIEFARLPWLPRFDT